MISVRRTVKVCVHKDAKRIKPISKSVLSLDSRCRSTEALSSKGWSCRTLRSQWDSYCSVAGAERRSRCVCFGQFPQGDFFWTLHWRTSSIRRTCQSIVLCQYEREMLAILSLQSLHARLGPLRMPTDVSTITSMLVIHVEVIGSGTYDIVSVPIEKCSVFRYVNCPSRQEDENLIAIQFNGELYYRTMREIQPGEEVVASLSILSSLEYVACFSCLSTMVKSKFLIVEFGVCTYPESIRYARALGIHPFEDRADIWDTYEFDSPMIVTASRKEQQDLSCYRWILENSIPTEVESAFSDA